MRELARGMCAATALLAVAPVARASAPTASGLLEVDTVNLLGLASGDNFGVSLAAGDFNGDGHADLVVGAPYSDINYRADGAACLFLGGSFRAGEPDAVFAGEAPDDQAGISVAAGFDLNNDGFEDVAVGVRFNDRSAGNAGAVFIYLGRANPDPRPAPDLVLVGEAADDWFGHSVAAAGDVNNDGFDDLVIGAPYNDAVANAAGRAYVVFGAATMATVTMVPIQGAALPHSHFGWSVSGGGDLNNDGYDDVVVGARLHGSGADRAKGRAYVFFGGDPFVAEPGLILEGENRDDWFGESVAVLGDVNGDGFDDLIVGAIYADSGGVSAAGEALVFFGGNPMNAVPDLRFAGPHQDAQAGNAVGSAGDVDADGFADMLVGIHFANTSAGSAAGQAVLLLGGAAPGGAATLIVHGAQANGQFGRSVGFAGEPVHGAGETFGVGAHYDNEAGFGAGRATLVRAVPPLPPPILSLFPDTLQLRFETRTGFSYQAEKSATLAPGDWQDFGLPVSGDGVNATVTDAVPESGERGFYRIRRQPE